MTSRGSCLNRQGGVASRLVGGGGGKLSDEVRGYKLVGGLMRKGVWY